MEINYLKKKKNKMQKDNEYVMWVCLVLGVCFQKILTEGELKALIMQKMALKTHIIYAC